MKKDKDKKEKKVVLHHSPALHSLFPPSRNTSCQRAFLRSRISRTQRFVLFFDFMNDVPSGTNMFFVFFFSPCHFQSDRNKRGGATVGVLVWSRKQEVAASLHVAATSAFQHDRGRSRSWIVAADETKWGRVVTRRQVPRATGGSHLMLQRELKS